MVICFLPYYNIKVSTRTQEILRLPGSTQSEDKATWSSFHWSKWLELSLHISDPPEWSWCVRHCCRCCTGNLWARSKARGRWDGRTLEIRIVRTDPDIRMNLTSCRRESFYGEDPFFVETHEETEKKTYNWNQDKHVNKSGTRLDSVIVIQFFAFSLNWKTICSFSSLVFTLLHRVMTSFVRFSVSEQIYIQKSFHFTFSCKNSTDIKSLEKIRLENTEKLNETQLNFFTLSKNMKTCFLVQSKWWEIRGFYNIEGLRGVPKKKKVKKVQKRSLGSKKGQALVFWRQQFLLVMNWSGTL